MFSCMRGCGPLQGFLAAAAEAAVKINRVRNVVMAVMANFLFAQLVNGSWGNLTTALDIVHGTSQHLKFLGNSRRGSFRKCQMLGCPMTDLQCSCPMTN